jgi:hypothetical protein
MTKDKLFVDITGLIADYVAQTQGPEEVLEVASLLSELANMCRRSMAGLSDTNIQDTYKSN